MINFLNEMINFFKMDGVIEGLIIANIIIFIIQHLINKIIKSIREELAFKKHIKKLRITTKKIVSENVETLGINEAARILKIIDKNKLKLDNINKRIDNSNNENRELHEIIGCYICLNNDLKFQN